MPATTKTNLLAASISGTLFIYPAEVSPALWNALHGRQGKSGTDLAASLAPLGVRVATEAEVEIALENGIEIDSDCDSIDVAFPG